MTPPRMARLGAVCEINPRLARKHGLLDDDQVGFVPMAAIDECTGTLGACDTRRFGQVARGYTCFAEDDVLFAKITPCMENGKAAIARGLANGRGFGSTEFHVLRAHDGVVLPEWLHHFVRQPRFRQAAARSFTGTAGQQRVPVGFMADAPIPLPALPIQRHIVDLLARAEGIIALRRQACRCTARLVFALHARLFGDPVANSRRWPVAPLGDLLEAIDSGRSPRCHDRPRGASEWGVLRLSALRDAAYDESQHKTLPDGETPDERHAVRDGDLLLVRKNTLELVGTPAYVWQTQGRMLLPDLIFRLRPKPALDPLYLWALLATPVVRAQLRRLASGTAASMPNISKERLRTLPVMVPPIALQAEFARHAAAQRSLALRQEAALAMAQGAFDGMVARAFERV